MGRTSWCGSRVIAGASQAAGLRADRRRVLLELVEGQAEARHEGVHEVADFGKSHLSMDARRAFSAWTNSALPVEISSRALRYPQILSAACTSTRSGSSDSRLSK